MCLAGGGVKGGLAYGATDEFGFRAVEDRVSIHDLHATILNLLGMDHKSLTYRYAGRDSALPTSTASGERHHRLARPLCSQRTIAPESQN